MGCKATHTQLTADGNADRIRVYMHSDVCGSVSDVLKNSVGQRGEISHEIDLFVWVVKMGGEHGMDEKKEQKRKFAWWVHPATIDMVEGMYRSDNCKSKSEYIEKAVQFYTGYLAHDKNKAYLPQVLVSTFKGMLDSYEDRQAGLLFKLAVEMCMMLHVTAATNEIDMDSLARLRGRCVQEVKSLSGAVSMEDAVQFQNEE